jgi:hypothetical protein
MQLATCAGQIDERCKPTRVMDAMQVTNPGVR